MEVSRERSCFNRKYPGAGDKSSKIKHISAPLCGCRRAPQAIWLHVLSNRGCCCTPLPWLSVSLSTTKLGVKNFMSPQCEQKHVQRDACPRHVSGETYYAEKNERASVPVVDDLKKAQGLSVFQLQTAQIDLVRAQANVWHACTLKTRPQSGPVASGGNGASCLSSPFLFAADDMSATPSRFWGDGRKFTTASSSG